MSMILGHLRTAFFILLFVGDAFFTPFGGINQMPEAVKDVWENIKENKMQYGIMVFFLGTMVQAQLT